MAFKPENMFLIKSGDNSLEILLRLQINIERVVNEILKEISSRIRVKYGIRGRIQPISAIPIIKEV